MMQIRQFSKLVVKIQILGRCSQTFEHDCTSRSLPPFWAFQKTINWFLFLCKHGWAHKALNNINCFSWTYKK